MWRNRRFLKKQAQSGLEHRTEQKQKISLITASSLRGRNKARYDLKLGQANSLKSYVLIKTIRTLPQIANVPPAKVVLLGLWHNQQPSQTDLS